MKNKPTRLFALVGSALMLPLIGGCTGSDSDTGSEPHDAVSAEQAETEFYNEAENLELAPGWTWPDDLADHPDFEAVAEDGMEVTYQEGYGRVKAGAYWFCSWSRYLVGADTETDNDLAIESLEKVTKTYRYTHGLTDEGRAHTDELLADIRLGDFAEFTRVTDLNCPENSA